MVYQIRNLVNGKLYIGHTGGDLLDRVNGHFSLLRKGSHHSTKLQKDYDTYGESQFDWDIVNFAQTKQDVQQLEHKAIVERESVDDGYNKTHNTGRGMTHPDRVLELMKTRAKEVGQRKEIKKRRSEIAKQLHKDGVLKRPKQSNKFRVCIKCSEQFEVYRNPRNGTWRDNKMCKICRSSNNRWR